MTGYNSQFSKTYLTMLFDKDSTFKKAQKNSFLKKFLVSQMFLSLAFSTMLRAEPTAQDNIKQAIKSGQLEQALKLLQQERQIAPKDEQLRFLEGVIQAQQGQTDKAIETFKKLTESNPELSEAYNNLGVLYAAKGKLEESRNHLEKALQTHPSYAAAHRNLSDVQSQLAKETYAKALQIDSKVKNSSPQLILLGSLDPQKRAPQVQTTTTVPAASGIDSAKPTPAVSPMAQTISGTPPAPVAAKPATPVPAMNTVKTDTKKDDAQQKHAKVDQTDVRNAISAWAKAWSQKDMNRYLGAYASSFSPPDKMSRAKWENDRQTRIVSKKTINVEINTLKIEVSGNKATARFQQVYESDNFKGNSHKTLEMIKQSDRWLITRETVN